MDAQTCLNLLRQVRDVAFATVDHMGRPQVRIIDVMLVEGQRLYFCTARGKAFYGQLMASGQVAITGMNQHYQMVRLCGTAEKLPHQREWIDRIFAENPSMEAVYPGESRYVLEPFCIQRGQLEFFDLSRTPIFRETYSLGNGEREEKGFHITDDCVGCGTCRSRCPQQCIDKGTPYVIRQEHCLHCGLCREICPVGAIGERGVKL